MKKSITLVIALLGICFNMTAQSEPTSIRKLNYATYAIDRFYVDTVNQEKLVEDAIIGMLKELDPHSTYMNAEEVKEMNEPLQGNFDGIGVQFNILNDTLFIISTIAGGPSEKVGVLAGDRIIAVNDTAIAGVKMSNTDIMKRLRGPKGTKVDIKVVRRGVSEPIDFRIVRDKIPIYSLDAAYMADNKTGYIRISRFGATTFDEFIEALEKLKKDGMKNLILDLQSNGGGYLNAAIDMANEFLDAGELIVYTQGRKSPREEAISNKTGRFKTGKLIVLVDESTASASEIVSGAVQDLDRGVIVGRRTFGKGLVQRPVPLPDGSMMRLTIARYYTPSGRSIQKPYTDGVDNYNKDILNRYNRGELSSADSIHFPDSLKYTTIHNKRTVYGGGGIMPDIFVPLDTTKYTDVHRDIVAKGVLNQFVIDYFDKNQKALKSKYKNFESFNKGFEVTPELLNDLKKKAIDEGVKIDEQQFEKSSPLIALQIKALIARDLFDISDYFRIINSNDDIYKKALEIINNDNEYNRLLSQKK
ncbi:MAG: S41 family peptidase [Bacteroidales bacterium]|nr:S41 family peptidase [Bacteroidales bacterium]